MLLFELIAIFVLVLVINMSTISQTLPVFTGKALSWTSGSFYPRGAITVYNHMKYRCAVGHVSGKLLNPQYTPYYWRRVV